MDLFTAHVHTTHKSKTYLADADRYRIMRDVRRQRAAEAKHIQPGFRTNLVARLSQWWKPVMRPAVAS